MLHHLVGEMPGRAEGARLGTIDLGCRWPWEHAGAPLLVASSSRSSADASGGQKMGPRLPHKPWIEAEGEEEDRDLSALILFVLNTAKLVVDRAHI